MSFSRQLLSTLLKLRRGVVEMEQHWVVFSMTSSLDEAISDKDVALHIL